MIAAVLLTLATSQAPAGPAGVTAAVSVSVLDKSGAMVTDLRPEEVTLKEDGQPRFITRVELDTRPLALTLLLDTSDALSQGVLRDLADPVMDFLQSLPPGVDRMLMTLGTPPQVVDIENPFLARAALKARLPFGKLSIYDGIAEACDLMTEGRSRRALVIVTTQLFTEEDQLKALQAVARAMPLVMVVQFQGAGFYAPCLDAIVKRTGGSYEQISSATGVGKTLQKLLRALDPPWVVVYETPSAGHARKVEVKVARKGTKLSVRPAGF